MDNAAPIDRTEEGIWGSQPQENDRRIHEARKYIPLLFISFADLFSHEQIRVSDSLAKATYIICVNHVTAMHTSSNHFLEFFFVVESLRSALLQTQYSQN